MVYAAYATFAKMRLAYVLLAQSAADWTRPKCGTPNTGQDIIRFVHPRGEARSARRLTNIHTLLISEWGKAVSPTALPDFGYPRPQMTRPDSTVTNMNGLWQFEPSTGADAPPFGKDLGQKILVPFPVEACLSGIGKNYQHLWYRTTFDAPKGASVVDADVRCGSSCVSLFTTYSELLLYVRTCGLTAAAARSSISAPSTGWPPCT